MDAQQQFKQAAAESAVALVEDGMILGLGTGSTAKLAVDALGKRVQSGLRVVGVPTSEFTGQQARSLGIPVSTLDEHPEIDLTIDGADEVEPGSLNLIKGRGGALLREKIVASASKRLVIIVDESKLVGRLGSQFAASGGIDSIWMARGGAKIGSAGRESSAATGPRWKTLCHRRRPLHRRLRVWADRVSGQAGIRIEQHGGRGGARAVSRDGFAGNRCWPGRRQGFATAIAPTTASAAKPARSTAAGVEPK